MKFNKTICLSSEVIPIIQRMMMREKNASFSSWVEDQLLTYERKNLKGKRPIMETSPILNIKSMCKGLSAYGCPTNPEICVQREKYYCFKEEMRV